MRRRRERGGRKEVKGTVAKWVKVIVSLSRWSKYGSWSLTRKKSIKED